MPAHPRADHADDRPARPHRDRPRPRFAGTGRAPGRLSRARQARRAADPQLAAGGVRGPRPFTAGGSAGTLQRSAARSVGVTRSEEHTSELQSLMRISYAVFCLKKTTKQTTQTYISSILNKSDAIETHT